MKQVLAIGRGAERSASPWVIVSVLFALLPLTAGLIFRTYNREVDPVWFEMVRQFELFFVTVELGVVLWARRRGLEYDAIIGRIAPRDRLALAIFFGCFWISSVFVTDFTPYAMVRASFWPLHLAFGVSVWHLVGVVNGRMIRQLALLLVAGFAIYVPLLALHFATPPDATSLREGVVIWSSALPGYLSVRHFGMEAGAALALLMGVLWHDPRLGESGLLAVASVALLGGLIWWSGTRSAVAAIAGACLITLVVRRAAPSRQSMLSIAAGLSLGAVIAGPFLPPDSAFGLFWQRLTSGGQDLSAGRIEVWTDVLNLFLARPLLGWGEGSMIWLLYWHGTSHAQPHNAVLQMLYSWGIFASAAAFWLLARIWAGLAAAVRRTPELLPAAMMLDTLFIMSMFDGALYSVRLIMLVALAAAIGLSQVGRSDSAS